MLSDMLHACGPIQALLVQPAMTVCHLSEKICMEANGGEVVEQTKKMIVKAKVLPLLAQACC